MSVEYLVIIIIIIVLTPGPRRPGPGPDPPVYDTFMTNIELVSIAGLIATTAATNPEETFNLRYGPLLLFPALKVIAGLYYNNTAATKVKQ
jgi:hypothetical protein